MPMAFASGNPQRSYMPLFDAFPTQTGSAMNLETFEASLAAAAPPDGVDGALAALWHAEKGDWNLAHEIAQHDESDSDRNWVRAYLHRVEGDIGNAGYWYRRAHKAPADGDLKLEWRAIVSR